MVATLDSMDLYE
jgi:hypothetical protein